jgi:hypothetical protein
VVVDGADTASAIMVVRAGVVHSDRIALVGMFEVATVLVIAVVLVAV